MVCMELTQTDAVFSRTTLVLFLCRNQSSPNATKLLEDCFGTKEALESSWEGQKSHKVGTTYQGAPTPRHALVSCAPLVAHLRVIPTPKNPINR